MDDENELIQRYGIKYGININSELFKKSWIKIKEKWREVKIL